jgi:hypothetical protein
MISNDLMRKYIKDQTLDFYNWYREMFSIPLNEQNEFFTYDKSSKTVTFSDGSSVVLNDKRPTPLLMSDRFTLSKEDMSIIDKTDSYSFGDIVLNYLLIYRPFGDKTLRFTLNLTLNQIESYIANHLGDSIDIEYEYSVLFPDGGMMLEQLSELIVVSSTNKSIAPAPGIREYKKKLFAEARKLHGDDLGDDIKVIVEIENKLEAYDRNYLKDDPTYGVFANDKIIGNARKNMHGTMGAEIGMDGNLTPVVENSLSEGIPADNKIFASQVNASRKASIMRGKMTQFTGADAKTTARVLNNIKVLRDDCKTMNTREVLLTKNNYTEYISYNIIAGDTIIRLTDSNIVNYIDKVVKVRSYLFCVQPHNKYCAVCGGRQSEDNKNIAIVLSTENNSIFTNTSMKAFHNKQLKLVDYDLSTALN